MVEPHPAGSLLRPAVPPAAAGRVRRAHRTAVMWVVVASAAEVADAVGAFRASFLYYANWYFIRQSADYFAADINRSPVIHFWSLAVEEQFYLLWPLAARRAVRGVPLVRRAAHDVRTCRRRRAGARLGHRGASRVRVRPEPRVLRHRHAWLPTARRRVSRPDPEVVRTRPAAPRASAASSRSEVSRRSSSSRPRRSTSMPSTAALRPRSRPSRSSSPSRTCGRLR